MLNNIFGVVIIGVMLYQEEFNTLRDCRSNGVKYAENSSGSNISLRTRLACTLRWLAGGSYIDICFEFGISPGSFYVNGGVLWGTIESIDRIISIGFPFDEDWKPS